MNIGLGNGFVPSDIKSLHELTLTQINVAIYKSLPELLLTQICVNFFFKIIIYMVSTSFLVQGLMSKITINISCLKQRGTW